MRFAPPYPLVPTPSAGSLAFRVRLQCPSGLARRKGLGSGWLWVAMRLLGCGFPCGFADRRRRNWSVRTPPLRLPQQVRVRLPGIDPAPKAGGNRTINEDVLYSSRSSLTQRKSAPRPKFYVLHPWMQQTVTPYYAGRLDIFDQVKVKKLSTTLFQANLARPAKKAAHSTTYN